ALTDAAEIDPAEPVNQFTLSHPLLFNEKKTGTRAAWYVQDRIRVSEHLTVDLGLRFDYYDLLIHDRTLAPRLGAAYKVKRTNTVFRASYNRLVLSPPLENVLLSSSPQAALLSSANAASYSAVPAERQNDFEVGFQQRAGRFVRLNVVHYFKDSKNFADDQQLFTTAVIFPVAIARGKLRGTEVRLDVTPVWGWTAYASYANATAMLTSPLTGGLLIGNAEGPLLEPGQRFASDGDERNELQFGVTYQHRSGAWFTFSGRHDSGIPTDFDPADFPGFDPRIQNELDPVRMRIKPRTIFNMAMGMELFRESRFPTALQLGVNNLTDRFYLYNFQSAFSGTHIGRPREVVGRLVFSWNRKK
ncbi:MAG: TonB-dependent receptor, partial [Candidatus Acidiferrum sp.]